MKKWLEKKAKKRRLDVKIPTEREALDHLKRQSEKSGRIKIVHGIGGWLINGWTTSYIYLVWLRDFYLWSKTLEKPDLQKHFTIATMLLILEHETLHYALHQIGEYEASNQLDRIHGNTGLYLTKKGKWFLPTCFLVPEKRVATPQNEEILNEL